MSERFRFFRLAALAAAAAALFGGAFWAARTGPSTMWLVQVLLCTALALIAYNGKIPGTIAGLTIAVWITYGVRQHIDLALWSGQILEWGVLIATTLFARDRVDRTRRSERQLAALLDFVDDAAFVLDSAGRYVEVWGPRNRLLAAGEVLRGKYVADYLPPEGTTLVLNAIRDTLAARERRSVDYELEIDGRTTWWNAMVTPISNREVLWVGRDITARKMAEQELQHANAQLERRAQDIDTELSEAMTALRSSEQRYRSIIEQARDVIFTLDPHGFLTSLNPAFEATLGWATEEWLGRDFRELLVPRVRDFGDEELARAHANDVIPITRAIVAARDGHEVVLEVSLVNQRVDGVTRGFFGFARDVTAREKAQEDLRRSERQLADTQRVAHLGSWEHDLVQDRVWWSEEHYRLFGLDPSESMTFERFTKIIGPEETRKLRELEIILRDRAEAEWELKVMVGGEEKILSCLGRMVRDADGRPIRLFGSAQDVTQQRRDEQRLREHDERFRLMSRATNDVVWDWDLHSNALWWGEGLETLFGWNAQGLENVESWRERIHPDDEPRLAATIAEARVSQIESWSSDYRFRRADDSYAYVFDRAYIVRDKNGEAVRMVGAITDLTERRMMQEQLDEATRLSSLGRVAASIAHEFNNVLMGMQANLEVLRRRAPVHLTKPVEHILHSVLRGKRVTDEILGYTRGAAPSLQEVLVTHFLTRWEQEIRPILGSAITLSIQAEPGLYMHVDPMQIAQVLTNLALNARDAMPDGGVVRITADAGGGGMLGSSRNARALGFVHFRVEDNGIGMTRDVSKHMFEPLFTTKHGGTGLGLAISYQIVNRHGGFIAAESEPGRGTTFDLLLPAAEYAVPSVEVMPPVPLSYRSIVIVDDDESVVAGLGTLLELDDVQVRVALRGGDAMPLLLAELPDAVILDIGLPDMSGADVYEMIAARWPTLPVLFSSGHADAARLEPWLRRPNVSLLLKPYDYDSLQRALASLVDRRGAGDRGNATGDTLPIN